MPSFKQQRCTILGEDLSQVCVSHLFALSNLRLLFVLDFSFQADYANSGFLQIQCAAKTIWYHPNFGVRISMPLIVAGQTKAWVPNGEWQ